MKNTFQGLCRHVDEFTKLNKLGEGGYGEVYKARDTKKGEIVALKKIKMNTENDGMPLTALREIQILKQMNHVNIVKLKEIVVGYKLNSVFLVFEYCEHDLSCLLDRGRGSKKPKFKESEVKNLMIQLLLAVRHLHNRRIVHRDIKLSNLLYTNKGELKLADFGLARMHNTFSGEMTPKVVTLWYRPPELLFGHKKYDGYAVDIWAIGCIMGELLVNKPLMPGKDEMGQLFEIFNLLGHPSKGIWEMYEQFPKRNLVKAVKYKSNVKCQLDHRLRNVFTTKESKEQGMDLIRQMLCFDPEDRIKINDALKHPYFNVNPLPAPHSMMPAFKVDQHFVQ